MKVNAIKCLDCGDTVFSRARHDFRWCSCKKCAIDGGFEYTKINFIIPPEQVEIEIEQTKKELYDDWNYSINKFGLIKNNL